MNTPKILPLALNSLVWVMLLASCAPPATTPLPAERPGAPTGKLTWERNWDETVSAAKAEGNLVIYGFTMPRQRQLISEAFSSKFSIRPEWVVGRSNEIAQKILSERRANIYGADVLLGGTMSYMTILKPAGALKPLEPDLLLPEVTENNKWFQGKLWWVDNERTHLAYAAIAMPPVLINTDLVKKGEIASYRDLLDPKWKGKILMDNPFTGGPGNSWVTAIGYNIMDTAYLEELAKQEPFMLQDARQEVDWIARGKYPIGIGQSTANISEYIKAGVSNIEVVTPREGTWLSQSAGAVSLLNKSPHPGAARAFLNWILTREGQTIISKAEGYQSARIDVPTDHVEPWSLRQPGVTYHDAINLESQMKKGEYVGIAKKIFGPK